METSSYNGFTNKKKRINMPNFVIENDDMTEEESNVASQDETVETTESQAEETEETVTEQPSEETPAEEETQEPTVEIDGEQVPLSEVKRLREEYKNDSAWKDKNRRESEALNREKKELESLKLLKPALEQRPDLIKELLQPKRDIDADVRAHYARRPDPYADPQAFANWEYMKDQLLREQTTEALNKQSEARLSQQEAQRHNDDLFQKGVSSYLEEKVVDQSDFMEMQRWILENVKDKNGKYPMNAFDIAYTALYSDRKARKEKVNTVKSILKSQEKAKPAVSKGTQKAQESDNELSESERAFVAETAARRPKRTME
jgi:hypothetical protein